MAYNICRVKNVSGEIIVLMGKNFEVDEMFQIEDNLRINWAMNETVIIAITQNKVQIHDGNGSIEGIAAQIAYLQGY